ncbi:cytidylate kinase [Candidatus Vecturithrix granuli]|uniref:Cytidylate kinase n=1 Tax=Vecturithrix granuli TaxID=1499967 RepID=A0A081C0Y7_VECG1|nr:cytidylate kinase [Candidatus Vecturithrix granuli]
MKKFVIAIDGPAGSGKSRIGDMLAQRLGYVHISTGIFYRAIGWKADQHQIPLHDIPALQALIVHTAITFQHRDNGNTAVFLDGKDVSDNLATNEAGILASKVSAIPEVRQGLFALQRRAGQDGGVILDGRDIGTVVFPDAEAKFYLDASPEERARRRFLQLQEQGLAADFDRLLMDIKQRDYDDTHRQTAPLRQAEDAMYIDSTSLSPEDVVSVMEEHIRKILQKIH